MADLSDTTLVAYVDGELDPAEHARVAALVAASPGLQARVAVFSSTREQLTGAFRDVLDEPVPGRLVDAVMSAPSARTSTVDTSRTPMPSSVARSGWRRSFDWLLAPSVLALASVALVAGLGGWLAGRAQYPAEMVSVLEPDALAKGALAESLETVTGGSSLAGSGSRIVLRLTFKSREGWCRQFEADKPAGGAVAGIACRDTAGRWHVRAFASLPEPTARTDGIRPAAPDGSAMLSNVIDRMIEGDALDARDEAKLIAGKWLSPRQ